MGKEEQIEEREVLESIFPDEITDISETEYRISIALELPEDDPQAATPPVMQLHVQYPEAYPDAAPVLGLTAPQNATTAAPTHPHFSVAEDGAALLAGLGAAVRESLGMAMVFTLVTALKEEAERLIAARRADAARAREHVLRAAEREENRKFHGTPVTPGSFARWRDGFLREMEDARARAEEDRLAELKKARVKEPARLTGKQLFERGLVGKGEYEGEEGEEEGEQGDVAGGLAEGVDKLKVAA